MPKRCQSGLVVCLLAMLLAAAMPMASPARAAASEIHLIIGEPSSLDPNIASDSSVQVTSQLFDPLYRLRADGTTQWLGAVSMSMSVNRLVWTYRLNPNARWSDGQAVTADDWVFSWLRILDPKTESGIAPFLSPIKNAAEYHSGAITDPTLVGLKSVNATTFEVTMGRPSPQFTAIAALPYLTAAPTHAIATKGASWAKAGSLVASGPYALETWAHKKRIVLVKNAFYGGAPVSIDRAVLTIASGDLCIAQLQAYEAGRISAATCVPAQDIAWAKERFGSEFTIEPLPATLFAGFDNSHGPWNDVRVRQALSLAVDRQAMVDALTDGTSMPASVLVPEGIAGRDPSHALSGDAATAKTLLAEAGFPDGAGFPAFTITVSSARGGERIAEMLQQMWRDRLGIAAKLNVRDENDFDSWLDARQSQPYDIDVVSGYTDYADPNAWYKDIWGIGDAYHLHYADPDYLALVDQAAYETDPVARADLFNQADAILNYDVPAIPLFSVADLWLVKPSLTGFTHSRLLGLYVIAGATLAPP